MAAWALGTAGHDNHAAARVVAILGEAECSWREGF